MKNPYRVLVFGLPRGTTLDEVSVLVGASAASHPIVVDMPGNNDQSMAVVDFFEDTSVARRAVDRIGRQTHQGHPLKAWLCVLPWH